MSSRSRPALLARLMTVVAMLAGLAACSAPALVLTAAGVATDTSMTWAIVKHLHGKLTEDEPTPCVMLNSVQRALNPRCDYSPDSIRVADFATAGLQACPLTVATADPRLWRALPELLAKGARSDACSDSPLQALAQDNPCPDFAAAPPDVREALEAIALSDPRAIRHDVFRMLGCPKARAAGLDRVLATWLDRGSLEPGTLSFNPLEAADPDVLVSRFGHELEVAGYSADTALDDFSGTLPSGFEEALRSSNWAALEWWLYRRPELANRAPPSRGGQLAWLPLQRVLLPGWLRAPDSQRDMVAFLLARGANPREKIPFDNGKTVIAYAAEMKSPMLAVLDPPSAAATAHTQVAGVRAPAASSEKIAR